MKKISQKYEAQIIPIYFFTVTKTSVKEQIRFIRAIRVSLNACGRRIAMSTRKLKCQWIKIWGKMDNDIFILFCLLMFYLPVNAQEPSGSFAQAQK